MRVLLAAPGHAGRAIASTVRCAVQARVVPPGKGLPVGWGAAMLTAKDAETTSQGKAKTAELRAFWPSFCETVATAKPRVVLVVGADAVKWVVGQPVTEVAGAVLELDYAWDGGTVTVPTVAMPDPGGVTRNPRLWRDVKTALARVQALAQGHAVVSYEPPAWERVTSASKLHRIVDGPGPVAWDIETADVDKVIHRPRRVRSIALTSDGRRVAAIYEEDVDRLQEAILDRVNGHAGLTHNGKFDAGVLAARWGRPVRQALDTQLGCYALDESLMLNQQGLAAQCARWLGRSPKDEFTEACAELGIPHAERFDQAPDELLAAYNSSDTAATWQLWQAMAVSMDDTERRVHDMLVGFSEAIAAVEQRGLLLDQEAAETRQAHLLEVAGELEADLPINPRSHKQVREWLEAAGARIEDTTAKTLGELVERQARGWERAEDILAIRKAAKEEGYIRKVLEDFLGSDGRVRPTYALTSTDTGRLSGAKPNAQQWSEEVKALFVAAPGHAIVAVDIGDAEGRVVAVESGDPAMLEAVNGDRHQVLAKAMGVSRQEAKVFSHGLNYGMSPAGLAWHLNTSRSRALKLYRWYADLYPGVVEWRASQERKVRAGEPLETFYGRRYRVPPTDRSEEKVIMGLVRSGLAFVPQSTASDVCMSAARALHEAGRPIVALVHDAIYLEVPEDQVEASQAAAVAAIQEAGRAYSERVPWPVDVEAGPRWH